MPGSILSFLFQAG